MIETNGVGEILFPSNLPQKAKTAWLFDGIGGSGHKRKAHDLPLSGPNQSMSTELGQEPCTASTVCVVRITRRR